MCCNPGFLIPLPDSLLCLNIHFLKAKVNHLGILQIILTNKFPKQIISKYVFDFSLFRCFTHLIINNTVIVCCTANSYNKVFEFEENMVSYDNNY